MADDPTVAADRERINTAVQGCVGFADDAVELQGAVATGWVVIAEWMGTDGERWLTMLQSAGMTVWQRDGMLRHAQGDWREGKEED